VLVPVALDRWTLKNCSGGDVSDLQSPYRYLSLIALDKPKKALPGEHVIGPCLVDPPSIPLDP
jgi:hypothetical protein